jgi:hypothetical protein
LQSELESVKNRFRTLVTHWPTDGAFKEEILRSILRRHVPESLKVARGFICTGNASSTEIDILIIDRTKPTLFKADDVVVVGPDAVRAIIEVKTSLSSDSKVRTALKKLSAIKAMLEHSPFGREAWTGLFVYEGSDDKHPLLLRATRNAWLTHNGVVDSIAFGPNNLVKFVPAPRSERSEWRSYSTSGFSASVFLAYLITHLGTGRTVSDEHEIWFPSDPTATWTYRMPVAGRKTLSPIRMTE